LWLLTHPVCGGPPPTTAAKLPMPVGAGAAAAQARMSAKVLPIKPKVYEIFLVMFITFQSYPEDSGGHFPWTQGRIKNLETAAAMPSPESET
jgi:hypothetical protein